MGKSDTLSHRSDHGSGVKDNDNMVLLTSNFFAVRALEGLQMVGEKRNILKEIQHEMETGNKEEVVIKVIRELMKSATKSVKPAEWLSENGILYHQGRIYVPDSDLQHHISALCHDSKISGHPGRWKTLELVSRNYWWQGTLASMSSLVTCVYTPKSVANPQSESSTPSLFQMHHGT